MPRTDPTKRNNINGRKLEALDLGFESNTTKKVEYGALMKQVVEYYLPQVEFSSKCQERFKMIDVSVQYQLKKHNLPLELGDSSIFYDISSKVEM